MLKGNKDQQERPDTHSFTKADVDDSSSFFLSRGYKLCCWHTRSNLCSLMEFSLIFLDSGTILSEHEMTKSSSRACIYVGWSRCVEQDLRSSWPHILCKMQEFCTVRILCRMNMSAHKYLLMLNINSVHLYCIISPCLWPRWFLLQAVLTSNSSYE